MVLHYICLSVIGWDRLARIPVVSHFSKGHLMKDEWMNSLLRMADSSVPQNGFLTRMHAYEHTSPNPFACLSQTSCYKASWNGRSLKKSFTASPINSRVYTAPLLTWQNWSQPGKPQRTKKFITLQFHSRFVVLNQQILETVSKYANGSQRLELSFAGRFALLILRIFSTFLHLYIYNMIFYLCQVYFANRIHFHLTGTLVFHSSLTLFGLCTDHVNWSVCGICVQQRFYNL